MSPSIILLNDENLKDDYIHFYSVYPAVGDLLSKWRQSLLYHDHRVAYQYGDGVASLYSLQTAKK